jgi:two-component system, LuxR family, response regulator FixJ
MGRTQPHPTGDSTVVVVEDDTALREALTYAFGVQGYRVQAFPDADDLWAHREVCTDKSCLVVDHNLPGMDGLTLIQRLRKEGRRAPAILVTTPTRALSDRAAALHVPLVEKPLLNGALDRMVESLLDVAA